VAKEYVEARVDLGGALVLSEFAGAAGDLRQAFLVNPYDLDGVKETLLRAINADPGELMRRMRAMRRHLRAHDVSNWANTFLEALRTTGTGPVADHHGKTGGSATQEVSG
jgi:trehalose 6-phosphate synthase